MNSKWLREADEEGLTPLDRAFRCGHRAIGEVLLQHDKDEPGADQDGTSPLHRAARLGLASAVQSLLTFGLDVDLEDERGETALHKAVRGGHGEVVELLMDASDVNCAGSAKSSTTKSSRTPFDIVGTTVTSARIQTGI